MNPTEARNLLCSLSVEAKIVMFARLGHELTVVARDTYQEDGQSVKHPIRLRQLNEIQHLLTSVFSDLVETQESCVPDSVITEIFFGERDDKRLETLLQFSFERASRAVQKEQKG